MVKVEHDSSALVAHMGEFTVLIGEQRDSDQWHGVVYGLIQTIGATVSLGDLNGWNERLLS